MIGSHHRDTESTEFQKILSINGFSVSSVLLWLKYTAVRLFRQGAQEIRWSIQPGIVSPREMIGRAFAPVGSAR